MRQPTERGSSLIEVLAAASLMLIGLAGFAAALRSARATQEVLSARAQALSVVEPFTGLLSATSAPHSAVLGVPAAGVKLPAPQILCAPSGTELPLNLAQCAVSPQSPSLPQAAPEQLYVLWK